MKPLLTEINHYTLTYKHRTTMNKYTKKPIEVEAVQVTEGNITQVQEWANRIMPEDKQILISKVHPYTEDGVPSAEEDVYIAGLLIPTKEGEMLCGIGDYLIKEPFPTYDRMFYPCKADMFTLTYDEVN